MTTKLYISYYGDYISIVEGSYNARKGKFFIKDKFFLSNSELDVDYNMDKYELLRQGLMRCNFKSKKVVLCLNTKDVVLKSNKIPKVDKKDLEGIMNVEIDEIIALDRDSNTFSYEVTAESEEEGTKYLEMIFAAIPNNELNRIMEIFDDFRLRVEFIDTIATSYVRVLKLVEYEDIMIANVGDYGTVVDIYKDDMLFIHDNVPIKLTQKESEYQSSAIAGEINGLMNYYSSRNFGKSVDKIVTIGKYAHNKDLINAFKMAFSSEVVDGIENLFDIAQDIKGNIKEEEISLIVNSLGCMLHSCDKKSYSCMNLLPEELKMKQKTRKNIKRICEIAPIVLVVLAIPWMAVEYKINQMNNELKVVDTQINEIKKEFTEIEGIRQKIKSKKDEVKIYDMLLSKRVTWAPILNDINKCIPFDADIKNLDFKYDQSIDERFKQDEKQNENQNQEVQPSETTEKKEAPLYEQIPNLMTIEGHAQTPKEAGEFVYSLGQLKYYKKIDLENVKKDETEGGYTYLIKAYLKEGVIFNG